MKISFYHAWRDYDYGFNITGEKTNVILELEYESTDSSITLTEVQDKHIYTIELWGGNGPSINEFHITDTKNAALMSLNDFIERVTDYASDEDIETNQRKIDEIKPYFSL